MVDTGFLIARDLKTLNDVGPKADALIYTVPLLVTNLIATLLIGYKAW